MIEDPPSIASAITVLFVGMATVFGSVVILHDGIASSKAVRRLFLVCIAVGVAVVLFAFHAFDLYFAE